METQPKYMLASLEDYLNNPTDDGAKILLLKYTKLGEVVPTVVNDRMIDVIEHEVLGFSSKLFSGSNIVISQVLELIYLAISKDGENLDRFWNYLHNPESLGLLDNIRFDKELLESARKAFPQREKLSNTRLYKFAVEYLHIEDTGDGKDLVDNMRKRYGRFVKAYK